MKPVTTAILTFLLGGMNIGSSNAYVEETKYLYEAKLKPNESIKFSDFYPKLELYEPSGSIGLKTFSKIHHLTSLEMQDSMIDQIEDGAFCSLPNLEELMIYKTKQFPVLTASLLGNCDKIKSFTAGAMQMESNALESMPNLETLQIREQNISHLTKDYMQSLKKLESLSIMWSNIDQIDAGSICSSHSLRTLNIHRINVPVPLTKSVFENCNTVTVFTFVYNYHADIEEEVFSGLVNAKSVLLNNLRIKTLTKGYLSGFKNVEHLRIEDSTFTKIDSNAFEGFSHLNTITLTGNQVIEIDAGAFSSLPSLDSLYLSINKLASIDNIANPTLKTLRASRNVISKVDPKAIKENLPNLEYLILSENNISREYESQLVEELKGIRFIAS